jgi:hypothetical protein
VTWFFWKDRRGALAGTMSVKFDNAPRNDVGGMTNANIHVIARSRVDLWGTSVLPVKKRLKSLRPQPFFSVLLYSNKKL